MIQLLLIEDNPLNRDMLTRRLERQGYTVTCAEDAETGLELAPTLQPAAVLMDINLPGIDGFEATRRLLLDPLTAAIPVIALTAHAMPAEAARAAEVGCRGFIPKPIDFPALCELLTTLTSGCEQEVSQ